MNLTSTQYKVRQCSKCPGNTEYFCASCTYDLCRACEKEHAQNPNTKDHHCVIYSKRVKSTSKQRVHAIHREKVFKRAFLNNQALLKEIKADFKIFDKELSIHKSAMEKKAQKMKYLIDNVLRHFDMKHRCLKQIQEINRRVAFIQNYEDIYERSESRPVQFLLSLKNNFFVGYVLFKRSFLNKMIAAFLYPVCLYGDARGWDSILLENLQFFHIEINRHTNKVYMNESLNKEEVIESLSKIKMIENGNRRVENKGQVQLISSPELHQTFAVTDVNRCDHISCLTSDRIWISDKNNLLFKNKTGVTLHHLVDLCRGYGVHTVNHEGELIYIDTNYDIKKLSNNFETITTLKTTLDTKWKPCCVHSSPHTGNLLVVMQKEDRRDKLSTKVIVFDQTGNLIQTIQQDEEGRELYRQPVYITENKNMDVVVSDNESGVVVTDYEGEFLFFYRGHPSRLRLEPRGICTDDMSNILVCDCLTDSVHIIEQNGQFLSLLLIIPSDLSPFSLSYDTNSHCLLVGSYCSKKVCLYKYFTRQHTFTGKITFHSDLPN